MRGDVGRLQVETLRFLQDAVDAAYQEAVSAADAGRLQPRLSRAQAIGSRMDDIVRADLKDLFDEYNIPYGPGADVIINNRDYETSENGQIYRIPDARIGDVSFDWTLFPKTISLPQIRGFFRADSQPRGSHYSSEPTWGRQHIPDSPTCRCSVVKVTHEAGKDPRPTKRNRDLGDSKLYADIGSEIHG
ncbi:MAG: hypothetical protein ACLPGW_19150 [Roseiarcus sp.]